MPEKPVARDPYIGVQPFNDLRIIGKAGQGGIGKLYKAVRESNQEDVYACKIIPEGKLRKGWERELQKLAKLKGIDNVVPYHWYGTSLDLDSRMFVFILFDFIEGIDLKQYLKSFPWPLDLAFIENVANTILQVLLACRAEGIQHGDLHEGNIMISNPDRRLPKSQRKVWVCDFGYGGSHNEVEPKDDYRQFFSIIRSLLRKLESHSLNPRDKVMHAKMIEFLDKKVMEFDPRQGGYVGDPAILLSEYELLASSAERLSAAATKGEDIKEPGDYLWAEALGNRADEWQSLFVPEFLGSQGLLNKDITIFTGARGCGKTMIFRRLTAFMDKVIGETSGVVGADQFIGFYLNCRDLAEAFPWLPPQLNEAMHQQIMHFFHLGWLSEILKTLAIYDLNQLSDSGWLDGFLKGIFLEKYQPLPRGANVLAHARAFIENEKERCRLERFGRIRGLENWPLARIDLLDNFQTQIESHVPWVGNKTLYFFLDDYTIPIIPREVQRALNSIIFKRRDKIFFKISTEAANSFDRQYLRAKPLEQPHDFQLIDLATESIHQEDKAKKSLLDKIFRPRIDRHPALKGRGLGLEDLLGTSRLNSNELARQMRKNAEKGESKQRIIYHGTDVFAGMWSSDVRSMIQMFTEILREGDSQVKKLSLPIDGAIQNKVYRTKGGEFLVFTQSINDPSSWEIGPSSTKPGEPYGSHLVSIVEAFTKVSRYELTKGKLVTNTGRLLPKQAFRLEIVDKFELSKSASRFYDGLVRWHIFLLDWRGKSVRGMITPRLFLNRVLIPHAYLTFSGHDNIQLSNEEFLKLLTNPKSFQKYWQEKRRNERERDKKKVEAIKKKLKKSKEERYTQTSLEFSPE